LFGGRRKWSIIELGDACSNALAEYRSRYKPVSKRTLQDDIRIMRSDILGFNAPIKQEKGLYFYSDSHYSILNMSITDAGLADKIYNFLIRLRGEFRHPELEIILMQLCKLTNRTYEVRVSEEKVKYCKAINWPSDIDLSDLDSYSKMESATKEKEEIKRTIHLPSQKPAPMFSVNPETKGPTWDEIFKLIS
jgi:hypothetical protein